MNSFKTFTDFGKGLEEIVEIIPEIKDITCTIAEDVTSITPKELTSALIEIVMNDFPYVDFRSPAVSVSYKEVGFKSRSVLSFGWKYINDGSGKLSYSFRISFYSHSRNTIEIEKKLAEAGWEQPQEKKVFFPYKNNFYKKDENKENTKPVNNKHDRKKGNHNNNKKPKYIKEELEVPAEPVPNAEVVAEPQPEEVVENPVEEVKPEAPHDDDEF